MEFFASNIRNLHTRRAYARAVIDFLEWCKTEARASSLIDIEPLHVAAWIKIQSQRLSAPSVKQYLAAIRNLFDWLLVGQIVAINPASSVRGPSHRVRTGKTPILDSEDTRRILNCIDIGKSSGLRDRALVALMVYSFARIGAALAMKVRSREA